jgi:hypothetical protein
MKFNRKKKCRTKSELIEYQALKELRLELGIDLPPFSVSSSD